VKSPDGFRDEEEEEDIFKTKKVRDGEREALG